MSKNKGDDDMARSLEEKFASCQEFAFKWGTQKTLLRISLKIPQQSHQQQHLDLGVYFKVSLIDNLLQSTLSSSEELSLGKSSGFDDPVGTECWHLCN